METLAAIRSLTVAQPAPDKPDCYSYGVQFVDLDPVHYTLLQNMTLRDVVGGLVPNRLNANAAGRA